MNLHESPNGRPPCLSEKRHLNKGTRGLIHLPTTSLMALILVEDETPVVATLGRIYKGSCSDQSPKSSSMNSTRSSQYSQLTLVTLMATTVAFILVPGIMAITGNSNDSKFIITMIITTVLFKLYLIACVYRHC